MLPGLLLVIGLAILLLAANREHVDAYLSGPSKDELQAAALHNLWPLPSFNDVYPKSELELAEGDAWCARTREWANTLEDAHVKRAYLGWVEYVEHGIAENREENRTHKHRREFDQWRAKSDAASKRATALASQLQKPAR